MRTEPTSFKIHWLGICSWSNMGCRIQECMAWSRTLEGATSRKLPPLKAAITKITNLQRFSKSATWRGQLRTSAPTRTCLSPFKFWKSNEIYIVRRLDKISKAWHLMFSGSLGRFTQMHSSKPASQQKVVHQLMYDSYGDVGFVGTGSMWSVLPSCRFAHHQSVWCCLSEPHMHSEKWAMLSDQNFSCLHVVVVNCVNDGPFVIDHHSLPAAWTPDIPRSSWSHRFFEQIRACKSRSTARLPRSQDLCERQWHVSAGWKNPQESIIYKRNL